MIMSREDGTQAEDRGRTKAPAGNQAEVSDKAAGPEKAVAIDGNIKKPGPEGPVFLGLNKYAKS